MVTAGVVKLEIRDFKAIEVAKFVGRGDGIVEVAGRNGAGKSTALDAIRAAVGGLAEAPAHPVRAGEDGAEIVLETVDLRIVRRWTEGGERASLIVETKDGGGRVQRAQTALDAMLGAAGAVSVDPHAFSRMGPKEQRELLVRVAGVADRAAEIEAESSRAYSERTIAGRRAKEAAAQAAGLAPASAEVEADEPVETAAEIVAAMNGIAQAEEAWREAKQEWEYTQSETRRLTRERAEAVVLRHRAYEQFQRAQQKEREAEAALDAMREQEGPAEGRVRIAEDALAEVKAATNAEARARAAEEARARNQARAKRREQVQAWRAAQQSARAAERAVADYTARLEELASARIALLEGGRLPGGLSVREDGTVWLDGQPFSQASTAQQIRAGLAVASAGQTDQWRVVLVRDASLLDDDAMAAVEAWAKETGTQVWLEIVRSGSGLTITEKAEG